MTAPFTKKELQAQIDSVEIRIARLKHLHTATIEESERNQMDLQKLEAVRGNLLDKVKIAPE